MKYPSEIKALPSTEWKDIQTESKYSVPDESEASFREEEEVD